MDHVCNIWSVSDDVPDNFAASNHFPYYYAVVSHTNGVNIGNVVKTDETVRTNGAPLLCIEAGN